MRNNFHFGRTVRILPEDVKDDIVRKEAITRISQKLFDLNAVEIADHNELEYGFKDDFHPIKRKSFQIEAVKPIVG